MNKKFNLQTLVTLGALVAIEVILSRFCSIATWNMKIGFGFAPVVVAAIFYGPLAGGIVGGLADFLGAVLFPIGAYFPGFTLTSFLVGAVFGLFLYKRQTIFRAIGAVAVNQLGLSLFINTLWISILYGSPYNELFMTRIVQSLILIAVQLGVITVLMQAIKAVKFHLGKQVAQ